MKQCKKLKKKKPHQKKRRKIGQFPHFSRSPPLGYFSAFEHAIVLCMCNVHYFLMHLVSSPLRVSHVVVAPNATN